jgi:poly(3-hydroxyalkanoate) synthetase
VGQSILDAISAWIAQRKPRPAAGSLVPESWTSSNVVFRELTTMRLREFADPDVNGSGKGSRALIVAPYALHGANLVDFAPGHSLVDALANAGGLKVFLTEWRSATEERRFDTIDSLLAELNVAVDDIGAGSPLALIGLCQGGWLAAAYCARFPKKVASLTLVGAPIDVAAERSAIADMCAATPIGAVQELLRRGNGLVKGAHVNALWPFASPTPEIAADILQQGGPARDAEGAEFLPRFMRWFDTFVDLPGVYYLQTFEWIFLENRLARGLFQALGETVDLKRIVCPLFLLVAESDEITSPGQLMAISRLAGTPAERIEAHRVAGRHLSLFMGRRTLADTWPMVGGFVARAYETHRVVKHRRERSAQVSS